MNNNSSQFKEVCGFITIIITGLAIIGACISYIVFGIMYLVQDFKIAHDCNGSSLWEYVLVAMILALGHGGAKNDSDHSIGIIMICLGFIDLGLAIWGGIELFDKSCDDLKESNIWKFGLVVFIFQLFLAALCLVVVPLFLICGVCFDSKSENISSEDLTAIINRTRNQKDNKEIDFKDIIPVNEQDEETNENDKGSDAKV
jgi:uncharacterized membrane protein